MDRWKRAFSWWGSGALWLGALLVLAFARAFPAWSERYAAAVYPLLVRTVGACSGRFPFSLGEWVIYALAGSAAVWLARLAGRALRRDWRGLAARAGSGLKKILWTAAVIFLLYTFQCGINYYRTPFSAFSGLNVRPSTAEELAALTAELTETANALARQCAPEGGGPVRLPFSQREASLLGVQAMEALGEEYPALRGYYPPAKPVLFSRGLSYLDLTGVYFPPTIEANYNADAPAFHIPETICHELSHLRGFMREDEANFIAYLACRLSEEPIFQYSGTLTALIYSQNALYSVSPELYAETAALLDEQIWTDFSFNRAYWQQFEGPVAAVSNFANDTYLKANAQPEGVRSYGRMVDLLLADYRARHGL
ncbi:MAG: DUF3810 domain-containing protein [Provencibacterium sp.]|jgi:hypothetical protein|nr:DUF3810 domain-containing protein [Provencibacterium sp.]